MDTGTRRMEKSNESPLSLGICFIIFSPHYFCCCSFRFKFWLPLPYIVSEREPHCVHGRAGKLNAALREVLEPRGWIEVRRYFIYNIFGTLSTRALPRDELMITRDPSHVCL